MTDYAAEIMGGALAEAVRAAVAAERARREAMEAECARLRVELDATERARQEAEEERDTALELVAPDAMEVARQRDARDAERLHALVVARVALADARASHAALAAAVRAERSAREESDAAWAAHITADDLAGAEEVLAIDARLAAATAALDAALLENA
jgi:hypothetical protein